jgi:hypothetical protein
MSPQFPANGFPGGVFGSFQALAIVAMVWGFAVTVFWMVCAWRQQHYNHIEHKERKEGRKRLVFGNPKP